MPTLVIHLSPEHRASPDQHWIRPIPLSHGWSIEGSFGITHHGLSKCGYDPYLQDIETRAIEAAIAQGVEVLFVEG